MKCFREIQIALARIFLIVTTMMLGTTSIIYAAGEIPYTFSPGETISSAQVNANFQALSAQIAALQAQLAPVSPVSPTGTYDYFLFTTGMNIKQYNAEDQGYRFGRTNYQGTLVFDASGTVKFNGTGGYTEMEIRRIIYPSGLGVSGTLSTSDPTDIGEATYTVTGSTVTVGGGVFVGTLSSDGKIFAGITKSDRGTGIMIGIKRPPTIP